MKNKLSVNQLSVISKDSEKLKTDNFELITSLPDLVESGPVLVELVDASGNRSTLTGDFTVSIDTRASTVKPPEITAVKHNAFQLAGLNPLVAGDMLRISVQGEPGCTAYADLGGMVTEKEVIGSQLSGISKDSEKKVVSGQVSVNSKDSENNSKDSEKLKTSLSDNLELKTSSSVELSWDQSGNIPRGMESDLASYRVYCQQDPSPLISLLPGSNAPGVWPIAELPAGTTHYRIENYRGGYISVSAKKNTGEEQVILTPRMRIPLQEVGPGSYEGTYKVQPGDYIRDGQLTACLVNRQGERSLPVAADDPVTIDTTVTIAINPEEKSLKADGKSRTEIQVEVKDAREGGVENRAARAGIVYYR